MSAPCVRCGCSGDPEIHQSVHGHRYEPRAPLWMRALTRVLLGGRRG